MSDKPSIVWLRDDLRLADNPALTAALRRGAPTIVVYVLDDESDGIRPLGGASRWWLHHSLAALARQLDELGSRLVLRRGPAIAKISRLVAETDAGAVFWNRRYGAARDLDATLKASLRQAGVLVESFQANLLFEPWTVTTATGTPFRVFTPFWKAARALPAPRNPLPAPAAGDFAGSGLPGSSDGASDGAFPAGAAPSLAGSPAAGVGAPGSGSCLAHGTESIMRESPSPGASAGASADVSSAMAFAGVAPAAGGRAGSGGRADSAAGCSVGCSAGCTSSSRRTAAASTLCATVAPNK